MSMSCSILILTAVFTLLPTASLDFTSSPYSLAASETTNSSDISSPTFFTDITNQTTTSFELTVTDQNESSTISTTLHSGSAYISYNGSLNTSIPSYKTTTEFHITGSSRKPFTMTANITHRTTEATMKRDSTFGASSLFAVATNGIYTDNKTSDSDTAVSHDNDQPHNAHAAGGIELIPVHLSHVKYPLVFTIVVILAGLSKIGFHYSHFLSSKVPESCVLIVLGIVFGLILYFTRLSENITLYAPHEFFLYLLPPIILEAAFCLHDRTFAENIGGVLLFAVLGTVLNCFFIGLSLWGLYLAGAMEEINCSFVQILVFSALIVAVDPVAVLAVFQEVGVNDTLYFLVFGESLLNDGVTVVLYNVMQIFNTLPVIDASQIFMGIAKFFVVVLFGLGFGVTCGLISALITKYTNAVKVVEPLIIFGFAYLSYILSELFEFSGITAIIACGIVQVHYAFHNITSKSKLAIKFFAKVMANASEIIIFLFLGLVTVVDTHDWKSGFALWSLFLCLIYRFIVTYSLSYCVNKFSSSRVRKIRRHEMFMISYGGLRGAICFSLVALVDATAIPAKNMFVTTTLFVIFFTVFVQGGTIKYLVKYLRVSLAETDKDMSLNEELSNHVFDHVMAGIEEILGYTTGQHHIKMRMDRIDDTIIRPRMLRVATKTELENISSYYEKLVMKEHYKNLQLSGATIPRVQTAIRHLDSTLVLSTLADGEPSLDDLTEAIVHRRATELQEDHNSSMHKFIANSMHTVRSRLNLHMHDKNNVTSHTHDFVSQLRQKHNKNIMLKEMRRKSIGLPATLSFQLDGTPVSDGKSNQVSNKTRGAEYVNVPNSTAAYHKGDDSDKDNTSSRSSESDKTGGNVTFTI